MITRREFMFALSAASAMLMAVPAHAQDDYPKRPVRIVVPFAAGGSSDIVARLIASSIPADFGQTVVVENMPGGGATLAAQHVARAEPDGYTLLLSIGTHAIIPSTARAKQVGFDLRTSFDPVHHMGKIPTVILVNPESTSIRTLPELIAYAKEHPGELAFASNGAGTTTQLQGELLQLMAGIELLHVPYQGSGPQTTAVLAGETPISVDGLGPTMSFIKSGQLVPLAITSAERSPALPDVPTIGEFLPGYEADSTMGLLAPAGTPRPILDKLHAAVAEAFLNPKVQERYAELGVVPVEMSLDDYRQDLVNNVERWAQIIKDAGLELE